VPPCPQCKSESAFINGRQFVCPECQHLWSGNAFAARDAARVGKDAIGKELTDGDSVPVIKDLKVKGSPSALTAGGVAQVACNFWGPQAGEARSLTESIWVKDSPATSPPLLAKPTGPRRDRRRSFLGPLRHLARGLWGSPLLQLGLQTQRRSDHVHRESAGR